MQLDYVNQSALFEEMGVGAKLNENKAYLRLWMAVLTQAIKDVGPGLDELRWPHPFLPKTSDVQNTNSRYALRWLNSEESGIASFKWVCSILDYDVEFVRSKVARYRGNFTYGIIE